MRRRWLRSRRELLRGLGLGLGCLPLLQATRSYGQPARQPRRFVCVMQPFGYRTSAWLPSAGVLGPSSLPDSTSPLAPHKDHLIFLPGLTHPGISTCGSCGEQAYGALLGVSRRSTRRYLQSDIATIDQVVAMGLQKAAPRPLPSLPLGVLVDARRSAVPLGARRCFWRGAGQPVDPEESPHALYARLFAGAADADADPVKRLRLEKKSLLDYVRLELDEYRRTLGTEDRWLVDRHQDSMREIERDLAALPLGGATCAPELGAPVDARRPGNFAAVAELQQKMLVAALACDVTRVATLQLADSTGSGLSLDFVPGIPTGAEWARIARMDSATGPTDPKRLADRWFMALFAKLLAAMSTGPAGATLLDQSVVLWATNMSDGNQGSVQRLPWLMAGRCAGYFRTGRVAETTGKPLHGVLAEICNAMEVPVEFYGDRAFGAPMPGLKA